MSQNETLFRNPKLISDHQINPQTVFFFGFNDKEVQKETHKSQNIKENSKNKIIFISFLPKY